MGWAQESFEVAKDYAYADFVEGEDPDQEYIDKALPILEERLMFGGARLAALMVYIYGESTMQAATFLN